MSRREILERELSRYIAALASDASYCKAILFGSLAAGHLHKASDIDLVVIQETSKPFWRRMRDVYQQLEPRVGTDLMVYTPEEYEQLCRERPFFREEIQAKGVVVYERA